MDENTIIMLKIGAVFLFGLIFIIIMKIRSESGIQDIYINEEMIKTGLELEVSRLKSAADILGTGLEEYDPIDCKMYFTDKEIILEQTGYDLAQYYKFPVLPMVICGKRQYLREKYPNNYIANVVDLKISALSEIALTVKMV